MNVILNFIISLLLTGTTGILCLFLCILSANKDELWQLITSERKENKNE